MAHQVYPSKLCVPKKGLVMVKIQKLPNGQLVITLPKQIALLKQLDKGTIISFQDLDKDSIILKIARENYVKK